jgi:hypothetical protein
MFHRRVFLGPIFFFQWLDSLKWAKASLFSRFHEHRLITLGRTPLDEGSARRRNLYLTTYNTHERQTAIIPAGFEPTIAESEGPQTHALDRVATRIGLGSLTWINSAEHLNIHQ